MEYMRLGVLMDTCCDDVRFGIKFDSLTIIMLLSQFVILTYLLMYHE
jgi:hypothetical protein